MRYLTSQIHRNIKNGGYQGLGEKVMDRSNESRQPCLFSDLKEKVEVPSVKFNTEQTKCWHKYGISTLIHTGEKVK